MSPTSRRHHRRICGCNIPLLPPTHEGTTTLSICPEITDIIIDFLHDDKHALRTCALVCKSWLPASRFHLFHSITINFRNASTFRRLMCCRHSTLPSSIVHLQVGGRIGSRNNDFLQFWTPPVNCIPHARALRSLTLICKLQHNTLPRSLDGFKTITVLNIVFVSIPTCGNLLDILAATPLLETATLSEIIWKSVGNIPDPQSFPYLHTLSVHCGASWHILDWLSKRPLPALTSVSIRAESSITGCQFLRTLGSLLQHLQVKMFIDNEVQGTHTGNQADEIVFFDSADLSTNTNLRSITIDTVSIPSSSFRVDPCFLPLLSMLFRTNLSCLDTISFVLDPFWGDVNKVPWAKLARCVIAHSNSLRSLNIILPGIQANKREERFWKHLIEKWEREIIGKLSGVQFGEKPLLAITNISFPPPPITQYLLAPARSSNR